MFGIHKLIITVVAYFVSWCSLAGRLLYWRRFCLPGVRRKIVALAQKEVETSTSDESVTFSGEAILTVDPLELIQAKADAKVETIRASEEKWRILAWVGGIGAVIVGILALLVRSPLDRKERNAG